MTPEEFITKTNEHLKYIKELYEKAHPNGKYLTITLFNGEWQYNNEYWNNDTDFPVIFSSKK